MHFRADGNNEGRKIQLRGGAIKQFAPLGSVHLQPLQIHPAPWEQKFRVYRQNMNSKL
jgi:hypothetical protein